MRKRAVWGVAVATMAMGASLSAVGPVGASPTTRPVAGAEAGDCGPDTGLPTGVEVVVVGDSLTRQARELVSCFEYLDGRSLRRARPLVASLVSSYRPRVLVVALGSNDVARSSRTMRGDMAFVASQPVECAVITTVKVGGVTTFFNRRWRADARRWNQRAAESGLVVADWNRHRWGFPEWFAVDGLHLTPVGTQAYDEFLQQAVDACP